MDEAPGTEHGCHVLGRPLRILFCGTEFHYGYVFSKEALRHEDAFEVIQCKRSEVPRHIEDADIAVPLMAQLDRPTLAKAKALTLILQFGVGVEGIDIEAATELGISVSNIPSEGNGNALSCAEMALYLTLACLRSANAMKDSIAQRRVGVPLGHTLFGKSVLIVGFGHIAKELMPRLKPFGARLAAVRRGAWGRAADASVESLLDEQWDWDTFATRASEVDVVILTCTVNASTRGLVNHAFLAACRPGIIVVNVARGGLLDYDSIVAGLQDGKVGSLGLDVQWTEPFDPNDFVARHPRVVLTPHVAGVTEMSYRSMAQVVATAARRCKEGLPPVVQLNAVKAPA